MGVIYRITNTKNGRAYIGKTEHTFDVRYPRGRWWAETHNKELMDDAYRYGEACFKLETLSDSSLTGDELIELENFFIQKLSPTYNKRIQLHFSDTQESASSLEPKGRPEPVLIPARGYHFDEPPFTRLSKAT